jgi:YggT family protein
MNVTDSFLTQWYFHIPNLALAALIYTLVGRYVLELIFAKTPDVVILKVFRQVTDPVVRVIRTITPLAVPNGLVIVFSIIWLMALRLFLFLTMLAGGMKLPLGA